MADEATPNGLDPEPVLGRQVDAVLRAIAVLGRKKHNQTFADVLGALALAEEEAQYVCGFVLINEDMAYVEKLKKYLIVQEYIVVDSNGFVSPGVGGLKRVEVQLPTPIEKQLELM